MAAQAVIAGVLVTMKKVSALDIRRSYSSEKMRQDLIGWLWIYLVMRPVSFLVTPLFINLGFSANAVTLLASITVICALTFILAGAASPFYFVVGATLINIYILLDCIDGNIARFQGQSSEFGALFDCVAALILEAFLPLCLGLGLYFSSPEPPPLVFGVELHKWVWLVAGGVESSSGLFRRVVSLKSQSGVERLVEKLKQENSDVSVWAVLPRSIVSFKGPLLLLTSLVGALGPFLLFYAAFNLLSLIFMTALALRKTLLVDRQRLGKRENR